MGVSGEGQVVEAVSDQECRVAPEVPVRAPHVEEDHNLQATHVDQEVQDTRARQGAVAHERVLLTERGQRRQGISIRHPRQLPDPHHLDHQRVHGCDQESRGG